MASVDHSASSKALERPASRMTVGWFAKRALLGIMILVFAFGSIAWLTNASIDDGEAVAAQIAVPAQNQ
jgi:hypothetical protein